MRATHGASTRVQSLDILRGLVMVIMALDHTRDFVHAAAMSFQPEDLRQTTAAIFMTRWISLSERNPLVVFGRVPLFYFVLHLAVIHAFAIGLTWLRHGTTPFLFLPPPTLGTPRNLFPLDYGWSLWTVYAVTAAVVAVLYPLCLWFARRKATRREWWLSYL